MNTLAHADPLSQYCDWSDALATDTRDAVMVARNRGYVESLEVEATLEAMRFHQRECLARYRSANVIEMLLGFESAMGNRWGVKR